jgi:hypothetical protein
MAITRKEIEGFGMPAEVMLARLVSGKGVGDLVADEVEKRVPLSIRIEPELSKKISFYAKQAKASRTAIVEIFLWSGVRRLEEQIELDGQMDLEEVKK